MRATVIALAAVFGFLFMPTTGQAAPPVLHDLAVTGSNIELTAGGCGRGWYPRRWVDRWGRWHVRCVPYRYRYY